MTEHLTQSAAAASLAAIAQDDGGLSCPHCGAEVAAGEAFCEACGGRLTPTRSSESGARPAGKPDEMAAPIDITRSVQTKAEDQDAVVAARPCANCGGVIGADGTARPAAPRRRRNGTTTRSNRPRGSPPAATAAYDITATRMRRRSALNRMQVRERCSWSAMACPPH